MIIADVTIVLVLYNSAVVVGDCLAVYDRGQPMIAVDNGSADGSVAAVRQCHPDAVVIENTANRGYGPAVNQAMARVETAYALIVNPDAVVGPEALLVLKGLASANGAGIAAPLLESPSKGLELSLRGPGERSHRAVEQVPDGVFCTWFATGAVWLVNMEAWHKIGGFDENIFLYNEDHEFCLRLTRAGYPILIDPNLRCRHLVSASVPATDEIRRRKEWNIVWSHLYVTDKHYGRAEMASEARRLLRQRLPKAVFYALVFNRKRYRRDAAIVSAVFAYLRGKPARA